MFSFWYFLLYSPFLNRMSFLLLISYFFGAIFTFSLITFSHLQAHLMFAFSISLLYRVKAPFLITFIFILYFFIFRLSHFHIFLPHISTFFHHSCVLNCSPSLACCPPALLPFPSSMVSILPSGLRVSCRSC